MTSGVVAQGGGLAPCLFTLTSEAMRRPRPTLLAACLALSLGACASTPVPASATATPPGAAPKATVATQPPLTALTASSGGTMPAEQARVHFDHAELHFDIHPATQSLDAHATLRFTAKRATDVILLDLDRNLPIGSVALDGQTISKDRWANPEGRLRVQLGRTLAAGQPVEVSVNYSGKPHVAKNAPWDGGFVWAHTDDGQPWVASAVEGEGCDLFWPCIDQTEGEPDLVDTYVTVPKPLVAPGNGVLIGIADEGSQRTYHWRAKHPNTYAISINVGPFEELQADYASRYGNTIPLQFWYLRGHEAQAQKLFAEFPRMLDFFEQEIGPYPWGDEKMGVVETPHKGMEHQTLNAYGNGYAQGPDGFDWLLQHEFGHEWFGNQMTNKDWDDMWLHEGFDTYMQPLYAQYLHGDMTYFAKLQEDRLRLMNRYPIVAGHSQDEHQVYDAEHGPGNDIYYKGEEMLHTLRALIGDKAFFDSIRLLVYGRLDPRPGNYQPRYADTRDYMDIVNRVTGRNLDWFFNVYLYDAALPKLEQSRLGDTLSLRWVTGHNEPFPMPVEVQVGDDVRSVPMTGGKGSLTAPARERLIVDPRSKLLRDMPYIDAYREWMKQQRAKTAPKKPAS
jgi:aminopeptidase N